MYKHIVGLTLGTLALASPSAIAGEGWHDDFDEAVKIAKAEGKDLFVDFTGSDWCGWCIRLHNEVFDFEEWSEAVKKDYVLVALDFPKAEEIQAKVPNPERNNELKDKYGVRGFPTILMMTADGDVYAQTGYQEGGPEAYLEHMKKLRESGRPLLVKSKKLIPQFEAAEGKAKTKVWEKILAALEGIEADSPLIPDSPMISALSEPLRWAFEVDPKNERGLKLRAIKVLLKVGQADEEMITDCHEIDPENEAGLLEQAVKAEFGAVTNNEAAEAAISALDELNTLGFKDQAIAFRLNYTAAGWLFKYLDDPIAAKDYALVAQKIGTDHKEMAKGLEDLLAELG